MTENNSLTNVSVTFRHTEPTEALKQYALEKISGCLEKFHLHNVGARVVLSVEKRDHSAEIVLQSGHYDIALKSSTEDLYSAIDKLHDTLLGQLRKQKDKAAAKHQSAGL